MNKRDIKKLAKTYEIAYKEVYEQLPLWRKKAIDEGDDYERARIAKKVIKIAEEKQNGE